MHRLYLQFGGGSNVISANSFWILERIHLWLFTKNTLNYYYFYNKVKFELNYMNNKSK